MPRTRHTHLSQDVVQTVTRTTYSERMSGSVVGVAGGVAITVGGCVFLWFMELYHKRAADALAGLAAQVVTVMKLDPANEGKCIHHTGPATGEDVRDDRFSWGGDEAGGAGDGGEGGADEDEMIPMAVPVGDGGGGGAPAAGFVDVGAARAGGAGGLLRRLLFVRRTVEMFQWVEETKTEKVGNVGGSQDTTTTYTYKKKWSARHHDSSKFEKQRDHENPEPVVQDKVSMPEWVKVGPFSLDPHPVINAIVSSAARDLGPEWRVADLEGGGHEGWHSVHSQLERKGEWYYLGQYRRLPSVGDTRVRFRTVHQPVAAVSVLGVQQGERLVGVAAMPLLVQPGVVGAEDMLTHATSNNNLIKWGLRILGAGGVYLGCRCE